MKAGLLAQGSIYALRHTYISQAIEGGVSLNIISENCCISVHVIEKNYMKPFDVKCREFVEMRAPALKCYRSF